MMATDPRVKESAFNDLDLLSTVVDFKTKFYPAAWAHYDLAVPGSFKLVPTDDNIKNLANDYAQMQVMFFGDIPHFDDLIDSLKHLEQEVNAL